MLERFENEGNVIDTLLNSFDTTDKKFNNMIDNMDLDTVTFGKNIKIKNYLNVEKGVDVGGDIVSKGGIKISGDIKGKRLCVGETCLDENHLKMLTDGFKFKVTEGTKSGEYIHSHSDGKRIGPHGNSASKFKMEKW